MHDTDGDPSGDRELMELAAHNSLDLHLATSVGGMISLVAEAGLEPYGWTPEQVRGVSHDELVHPDDVDALSTARAAAVADPTGGVTATSRLRCRDGSYQWTEAFGRLAVHEGEQLIVWTVRDITDRRRAELDMERRAATDPLTGVANRIVFRDRLEQALRRLERSRGLVAVLFLDLDRFKLINDSIGHLAGDAVLLQMAERARKFLRPHDTLARLGGDEFAIVVEDLAAAEEASALGARIIAAGQDPFVVGHETFVCTTSIGIAVAADSRQSADAVLREADLALYRAKEQGRDRAEVFDEGLRDGVASRLGTERMLRRAVTESRLRVAYQPMIEIATGRIAALEALVRVLEPDTGELLSAESFVSVAEEAGLLARIDDWMLERAVEQSLAWRARFDGAGIAIAVNVTARHLADADFAEQLVERLAAHGLPPSALQVEVTEQVLMAASNSALTGLREVRASGIKIGLDDFGTGFSSLTHLRLYPIDVVKIDRTMVSDLSSTSTTRTVVAAIIDLVHAFGKPVVAEGVETEEQLELLAALGCDRAQGFLLAPPGTAAEVTDWMARTSPAR